MIAWHFKNIISFDLLYCSNINVLFYVLGKFQHIQIYITKIILHIHNQQYLVSLWVYIPRLKKFCVMDVYILC